MWSDFRGIANAYAEAHAQGDLAATKAAAQEAASATAATAAAAAADADAAAKAAAKTAAFLKQRQITFVSGGFTDASAPAVITGAQSHLYLETQAALLTRVEDRFEIHHSTQSASDVQAALRPLLGLTSSADIVVHNKRVGGGFGGKTTCSAFSAAWAAIACLASPGAPAARVVLDRQVDTEVGF